MNSKRNLITGIILVMTALSTVSCVTNRKVAYLQDMKHGSQIELENKFEAVISPYDELDIIITCFDTDLARPFNIRSVDAGNMNSNVGAGYLVDQYGNIELPVLGTIHAAGLTRLELQERVRNMLISGGYISDPYVMARFRTFKVFFLGANGGKAITVPNERCTFLEALALSGDMTVFTDRAKILVMRDTTERPEALDDLHLKTEKRASNYISYLLSDVLRRKLKQRNLGKDAVRLFKREIEYWNQKDYQFKRIKDYECR